MFIEGAGGRHSPRAVRGASFTLEFTIVDARRAPATRRHAVAVRLGRAATLFNATYSTAAPRDGSDPALTYRVEVPCPHRRLDALLTLEMVNEHGQYFEDAIAVSFNSGFELVLKWVALIPFAVAVAAVALSVPRGGREDKMR